MSWYKEKLRKIMDVYDDRKARVLEISENLESAELLRRGDEYAVQLAESVLNYDPAKEYELNMLFLKFEKIIIKLERLDQLNA